MPPKIDKTTLPQLYKKPKTKEQIVEYVNETIKNDVGFTTSLTTLDINVYACNWDFVEQLYSLFKQIESGPPDEVIQGLETLIEWYGWAYGTTHSGAPITGWNNIRTYLESNYGV